MAGFGWATGASLSIGQVRPVCLLQPTTGLSLLDGQAVLDFGGNVGNLLLDPDCAIHSEDYYCVDVIQEALEEGRRRFPHAHWVHFNHYNCSFNPEGIDGLPIPDMGIESA